MIDYVGGTQWIEARPLPIPLGGLRPALLAGVLHLTGDCWQTFDRQSSILSGGGNYETGFTDSILAWNPEMEDWSLVGNMLVARYDRPIYLPTWYHRPDKYVNFQRGFYCCFSQLNRPEIPLSLGR